MLHLLPRMLRPTIIAMPHQCAGQPSCTDEFVFICMEQRSRSCGVQQYEQAMITVVTDGASHASIRCCVRHMATCHMRERANRAVDTYTLLALCHLVVLHCVQQYVVAMTTLVGDGASPAFSGCCVRPIPSWSTCVRASRAILPCYVFDSGNSDYFRGVQEYERTSMTLVRYGASPALFGCCVRPMSP